MKTLLLLLIASTALAAPVDELLLRREHPLQAAEVRALGAHADSLLIAVASDAQKSRFERARALLALRFVPSPDARHYLIAVIAEKRAAESGADVLDLQAAAQSLAPYGKEVLPELLPLLTHAYAGVRQSAAAALGSMRLPEADGALRTRLAVERDVGVRAALARALRR